MTDTKEVFGAVSHVRGTETGTGEAIFRKLLKACITVFMSCSMSAISLLSETRAGLLGGGLTSKA